MSGLAQHVHDHEPASLLLCQLYNPSVFVISVVVYLQRARQIVTLLSNANANSSVCVLHLLIAGHFWPSSARA
jgi:hypothetical protein